MLEKFKKHVEQHFPFLENKRLLIAISGGIDSVVLTHLAHQLGFDFSLCHCNFQLRGPESDKDESFVKKLGEELNVKVFTTSFQTEKYAEEKKLSIQVAARELRYTWFYELIEKHNYNYVLTAHNSNDNLETFLINLTRGTGLEGLTGIPPINHKSIRPLLKFSRDDIQLFAIKNEITWREDRSNANIKYVRNKVRHKIVPILQEINPHLLETFQKTLEHLNESQSIVNDTVEEITNDLLSVEGDVIKIHLQKLNELKNKKGYLYQVLKPYGFTEWNDVLDLITAQSGKQVFSKTHRLLKNRNSLILTDNHEDLFKNRSFTINKEENKITSPIQLTIEETSKENTDSQNAIIVDKDLLKFPLRVRKWSYGDYICPIGMEGSKKLSQLFKDKKLSLLEKEKTWLLTDAEDNIIWVIGMRQDRRFIVTKNSKNLLKILHVQ